VAISDTFSTSNTPLTGSLEKLSTTEIYFYRYVHAGITANRHPTLFVLFQFLCVYGCKTWSLILREEHRLRVFENRVLRRIFGPKRNEVTGEWRTLHNEELHDLYSSPSIIRTIKSRRMRWAGHVARIWRRGTRIGYWWEIQRERDH
jgi:hypothetical protein